VFVGCVDDEYALVQHNTLLFLVHTPTLSEPFFRQRVLHEFGNFRRLAVEPPAPLREVLRLALDAPYAACELDDEGKEQYAAELEDTLVQRAAMLDDYFSLRFETSEDGVAMLSALPELVQHYVPPLLRLPEFLFRASTCVDWRSEIGCFRTLAAELARFYALAPPDHYLSTEPSLRWLMQHAVFPAMRTSFSPPRWIAENGRVVVQIADLKELFRVFERC
jgi:DNA mismatch repair protein MLH1